MAIETYQKAIARDEVQEMIRARRKARMDYESGMASARARGHAEGHEQELPEARLSSIKTDSLVFLAYPANYPLQFRYLH